MAYCQHKSSNRGSEGNSRIYCIWGPYFELPSLKSLSQRCASQVDWTALHQTLKAVSLAQRQPKGIDRIRDSPNVCKSVPQIANYLSIPESDPKTACLVKFITWITRLLTRKYAVNCSASNLTNAICSSHCSQHLTHFERGENESGKERKKDWQEIDCLCDREPHTLADKDFGRKRSRGHWIFTHWKFCSKEFNKFGLCTLL